MRRFLIALTFMLLAGLGLAASASFVAAAALPTTAAYGYDREHDIDGADHTAPARGSSLQRVPVDISAGQRPAGDHGSHASVPRSAYGYDAPSTSTIPPASPRIDAPAARPGPLASSAGIRVVSGCCVATKPAIGFAEGLGQTALTAGRLQHGTKNLTKAGVLSAWSGKTSPGNIRDALTPVLERPAAAFDHTLGGTAVRGFVGEVNGQRVAAFVYKEGKYQGELASSFVPSANQLKMWGVQP